MPVATPRKNITIIAKGLVPSARSNAQPKPVATMIATGLGWAFDRALGTNPFAMIVMFFLGVATGMLNVYRAITGKGAAVGFRRPQGDRKD